MTPAALAAIEAVEKEAIRNDKIMAAGTLHPDLAIPLSKHIAALRHAVALLAEREAEREAEIAAAVAAERERCARIAEALIIKDMPDREGPLRTYRIVRNETAQDIAAAIREPKP